MLFSSSVAKSFLLCKTILFLSGELRILLAARIFLAKLCRRKRMLLTKKSV